MIINTTTIYLGCILFKEKVGQRKKFFPRNYFFTLITPNLYIIFISISSDNIFLHVYFIFHRTLWEDDIFYPFCVPHFRIYQREHTLIKVLNMCFNSNVIRSRNIPQTINHIYLYILQQYLFIVKYLLNGYILIRKGNETEIAADLLVCACCVYTIYIDICFWNKKTIDIVFLKIQ